ncbi:MAG: hypothetical protein RR404_03350 [Bacilli bacterium]
MKKKYLLLFYLIMFVPFKVFAAGTASISGQGSVENGSDATINVTIKNTAAWNLKLIGLGSTSGCSNTFADVTSNGQNTTKTFSITCRATSLGIINFSVSGDITSSDGTNSNVSLSKSVSVVTPRQKESEAKLGSLSVNGYEINFNMDKTEYSISVPPTETSITINAKAKGTYASVSGTGKKDINEEGGKFVITCIAENGFKKEYVINVSMIDDNPIKITIDGNEYTIVKTNRSLVKPINYEESTIKINEFDIPSYTNDKTKLIIVGIKDNTGNIYYAIYDNGNYKIYNENTSDELLLYISKKELNDYDKVKITINEKEYFANKIDDRFFIVYAMNINTGESNYYKYDKIDNTFQYYELNNSNHSLNIFVISTVVLGLLILGLGCYTIYSKNNKNNKNNKSKK